MIQSKFAISAIRVIVIVRTYFLVWVMSVINSFAAPDCSIVVNIGYFINNVSTMIMVVV